MLLGASFAGLDVDAARAERPADSLVKVPACSPNGASPREGPPRREEPRHPRWLREAERRLEAARARPARSHSPSPSLSPSCPRSADTAGCRAPGPHGPTSGRWAGCMCSLWTENKLPLERATRGGAGGGRRGEAGVGVRAGLTLCGHLLDLLVPPPPPPVPSVQRCGQCRAGQPTPLLRPLSSQGDPQGTASKES